MYLFYSDSYCWIVKYTALFTTNFLLSACPAVMASLTDPTGPLFTIGVSGCSGGSDGSDESDRSDGASGFDGSNRFGVSDRSRLFGVSSSGLYTVAPG